MNRVRSAGVAFVATFALLTPLACGDDATTSSSVTTVSTTIPSTNATPTTNGTPTTTPTSSSVPNGVLSPADLDAAKQAVVTFVDSLGKGAIDNAASVVGPISEQHATATGGLKSMLQQSTEGHGAWVGAADRSVTAIGVDYGLAVVVLEGTLHVEGAIEHRVAAFPVRKAESAGAWFVEPWAFEIAQTPPLVVRSPSVDPVDFARVELDDPIRVTVETELAGDIWVSYDAQAPSKHTVEAGARSTTVEGTARDRVTVVFASGPTLYAKAFRLVDDDAPPTTTPPSPSTPVVSVAFLDDGTNRLLQSCVAGNDSSCDAAQVPGVLDDGAFSFFHRQCNEGDRAYCALLDQLVEAELRLHAKEGK